MSLPLHLLAMGVSRLFKRLFYSIAVCCVLRVCAASEERVSLCTTEEHSLTLVYTFHTTPDTYGNLSLRFHLERSTLSDEMGTEYEARVWSATSYWKESGENAVTVKALKFEDGEESTDSRELNDFHCRDIKLACCTLFIEFLHKDLPYYAPVCGYATSSNRIAFATVALKHFKLGMPFPFFAFG